MYSINLNLDIVESSRLSYRLIVEIEYHDSSLKSRVEELEGNKTFHLNIHNKNIFDYFNDYLEAKFNKKVFYPLNVWVDDNVPLFVGKTQQVNLTGTTIFEFRTIQEAKYIQDYIEPCFRNFLDPIQQDVENVREIKSKLSEKF